MMPIRKTFLVAASVAAILLLPHARDGRAAGQAPVQLAVQTLDGAQDVPVRTALLSGADRDGVNIEPVRWRGGGWYGGYRPYYGPSYYSYYPYATRYYSNYPSYSYYYPSYGYYGPRVVYRSPWYYRW